MSNEDFVAAVAVRAVMDMANREGIREREVLRNMTPEQQGDYHALMADYRDAVADGQMGYV
jgi:hypothetical protein